MTEALDPFHIPDLLRLSARGPCGIIYARANTLLTDLAYHSATTGRADATSIERGGNSPGFRRVSQHEDCRVVARFLHVLRRHDKGGTSDICFRKPLGPWEAADAGRRQR
jgi:hypothetical protein